MLNLVKTAMTEIPLTRIRADILFVYIRARRHAMPIQTAMALMILWIPMAIPQEMLEKKCAAEIEMWTRAKTAILPILW